MSEPAMFHPRADRAIIYTRQSTTKEESISLELQERAAREHAAKYGYEVVGIEQDPGISGRRWNNRPGVQKAMSAVADGNADVIILWKWSRLSRARLDWAVAADAIEQVGGRIESATEPVDTTTSVGRFTRGMLTELAAFESERIGDVWKETHARRIRNGVPHSGRPRFGYAYTREDGFTPDPVTGPILAEMYTRYIAGDSVRRITRWLNDGPSRPATGGPKPTREGALPWNPDTVRRILDSGFGAGFMTHHKERVSAKHEPVISADEWEAYLSAREQRAKAPQAESTSYLLSGLIYCACGSRMNGGMYGSTPRAKYRCRASHHQSAHPGGITLGSFVEREVMEWLQSLAEQINASARNQPVRIPTADPSRELEQRISAIASKLDAALGHMLDGTIPRDSYERVTAKLVAEQEALEVALRAAKVQNRAKPAQLIPDLLANWDEMTTAERRTILAKVIERITVTPGAPRATVEITGRV